MTRASPKIMASCRGAFLGVALLSGLINLLYLSGSIFMMEVYDRVLPSRSIPTLVGLSVIIVVLYLFQGTFDMIRGRILARIGATVDEELSQKVFQSQLIAPLRVAPRGRRPATPARSRPDQGLSGRRRSVRPVRSALDAALSVRLLCLPPLDRAGHVGRRHVARGHDVSHRGVYPRSLPRGGGRGGVTQRHRRRRAPQCGGRSRHGHGAAHRLALGRGQRAAIWRTSSALRMSPAGSARFPRCCACCCSPRFWESAPIWSSTARRQAAS